MKNKSHQLWLFFALISFPFFSNAQYYLDWAKRIGSNVNTYPKAQTVDNQGNVYVTGDHPNFFITKMDSIGNVIWEKTTGSTLHTVNDLASDENDNIYIVGKFFQTHDFDWSDNSEHLITVNEQSIFIAKYDGNGIFQWVHYSEAPDIQLNELEIAPNGDIILVGNFTNTVNIGLNGFTQEVSANEIPNMPGITYDVFIARYNSTGDLLNHIEFGTKGNDLVKKIAFTPSENIIAVGHLAPNGYDTLVNLGNDFYTLPHGTLQGFMVEINSDWNIQKSQIIEGQLTSITGMDVDASSDIFITGRFQGNCDLNGFGNSGGELNGGFFNDAECFAAKYNNDFTLNWGFQIGGPDEQFSKKAVLSENGFWITGEAQGLINESLFFYHSDSTYTFQTVGGNAFNRMYLALLDKTTGAPIEQEVYTTNWYTSLTGLDIGNNNSLYFSGQFEVEQSFDDEGIPYLLNSVFSTNDYKTSVYVTRRTPFCLPIEILNQPDNSQTHCQQSFDYELLASGTGLRYQWYQDDVLMNDFINIVSGWFIEGTHSNHLDYHGPAGGGWSEDKYLLKIENSCGDMGDSDTIQTLVIGNPSILVNQPVNYAIVGDTVKFGLLILDDYPTPSFQWYKGQNPLVNGIHFSGVDTDTLIINGVVTADEANYFCVVGNEHCSIDEVSSTSTLFYLGVSLTNNKELENKFSTINIFPNPVEDFITIDFQQESFESNFIQITDVHGRVVKHIFLEKNHPQKVSIDVQNISSGIYSINIFGKKNTQSQKLIIR